MPLLLLWLLSIELPLAATPEDVQRAQGARLLSALSQLEVDHELKRLWMAVATSSAPVDLAFVKWALGNRAVLGLTPDAARIEYAAGLEAARAAEEARAAAQRAPAQQAAEAEVAAAALQGAAPPAGPAMPAGVAIAPGPLATPVATEAAPASATSREPVRTVLPRVVGGLPYAPVGEMAEATLPSGMRVVVVGDPALSVTAIVHQVRVGSGHERPGTEGLAHLAEHLMFEGKTDAGSWMDASESLGAYSNATTSQDSTVYVTSVAPDFVREAIHLEATRFLADLPTERIDAERAVIEDELRMRGGLEPYARVFGSLTKSLFDRHPYGRPVGGTPATLAGLTADIASEFVDRAYGGTNMDLVIVGPQAATSIMALVEREYVGQRAGVVLAPLPTLDGIATNTVNIRVAGLRTRYAGQAWHVPATSQCAENAPQEQRECQTRFWTQQVMLGLLESEGSDVLTEALVDETSLPTPIEVAAWRGQSGGYVLVVAPLEPEGLVALNNTGVAVLGIIKGILWIPTYGLVAGWRLPPWHTNPTPAMVRRVLADSEAEWVDEAAIARVQEEVLIQALSRSWHAEDRAMVIADRLLMGMPPDVGPREALQAVTPEGVKQAYQSVIQRRQGTRVHVH